MRLEDHVEYTVAIINTYKIVFGNLAIRTRLGRPVSESIKMYL
jgi:hypothetical protein